MVKEHACCQPEVLPVQRLVTLDDHESQIFVGTSLDQFAFSVAALWAAPTLD
jgi:hypothetical protein